MTPASPGFLKSASVSPLQHSVGPTLETQLPRPSSSFQATSQDAYVAASGTWDLLMKLSGSLCRSPSSGRECLLPQCSAACGGPAAGNKDNEVNRIAAWHDFLSRIASTPNEPQKRAPSVARVPWVRLLRECARRICLFFAHQQNLDTGQALLDMTVLGLRHLRQGYKASKTQKAQYP